MNSRQRSLKTRARTGFGRVEVLVLSTVILVLVAILIPAVFQAREAARRTQCRNNLKAIGIAILNYHEQFKVFQPGYIANLDIRHDDDPEGPGTGEPKGYALGWGWQIMILANIDCAPMLGRLGAQPAMPHGNTTWYNGLPQTQDVSSDTQTFIPVYRCPSDVGGNIVALMPVMLDDGSTGTPCRDCYGRSNYVGMAGWFNWDPVTGKEFISGINKAAVGWKTRTDAGNHLVVNDPLDLTNPPGCTYSPRYAYTNDVPKALRRQASVGRGVFGENSKVWLRAIVDGVSNTIQVGERCTPTRNDSGEFGNAIWAGVTHRGDVVGRAGALADANLPPNYGNGNPAIQATSWHFPNTTGLMSPHSGGVNVLMADGSSRFLNDSISLELYRKLSVIDDGYTTEGFD